MAIYEEPLESNRHITERDVEWLHALVGDWQLLSDLAFSDLVLWFPSTEESFVSAEARSFIALAQARPSTTQTLIHRDVVGDRIRADLKPMVERAWSSQVVTNSSDQGQPSPARMRVQGSRCPRGPYAGGHHPALLCGRPADPLPAGADPPPVRGGPAGDGLRGSLAGHRPGVHRIQRGARVGDGLLRLDAQGEITFASPNAVSALLRLGVSDAWRDVRWPASERSCSGPPGSPSMSRSR